MNNTALKGSIINHNQSNPIMIAKDDFSSNKLKLSLFMSKTELEKIYDSDKVLYFILPSKVTVEGITYDTYGIGAIENNIAVDYILDLSTDFDSVKAFVDLCNANELSLIHLKDVAEDFLIA